MSGRVCIICLVDIRLLILALNLWTGVPKEEKYWKNAV